MGEGPYGGMVIGRDSVLGGGVRKVGTWAIKVDQLGGLNLKGP